MTFCWPISPFCMVQEVKSLEFQLLVLCQVSDDEVMKVSQWCRMFGLYTAQCNDKARGVCLLHWAGVPKGHSNQMALMATMMFSVLWRSLSSSVSAEGLEMSHFCHFWAFWPLLWWNILERGAAMTVWLQIFPSLAIACCTSHLCSLGDALFCSMVNSPLCSMVDSLLLW